MFFDTQSPNDRPMNRRTLNALLAACENDLQKEAKNHPNPETAFDPDGFLRIQPSWGLNAHRRGNYELAA